jgi:hypothetical protein
VSQVMGCSGSRVYRRLEALAHRGSFRHSGNQSPVKLNVIALERRELVRRYPEL